MARLEWIEHRLLNWARWKLMRSGGTLGYAAVDLAKMAAGDSGRDGYRSATVPVSDIEASQTDAAVARLPSELLASVQVRYLSNLTQAEKLRRLCCSARTLQQRVERAHRLLADHFMAQQDRQRAERERVEAVQRARRP